MFQKVNSTLEKVLKRLIKSEVELKALILLMML